MVGGNPKAKNLLKLSKCSWWDFIIEWEGKCNSAHFPKTLNEIWHQAHVNLYSCHFSTPRLVVQGSYSNISDYSLLALLGKSFLFSLWNRMAQIHHKVIQIATYGHCCCKLIKLLISGKRENSIPFLSLCENPVVIFF